MTRVETLLDSELEPRIKQLTSYGSFHVVTLEPKTWDLGTWPNVGQSTVTTWVLVYEIDAGPE